MPDDIDFFYMGGGVTELTHVADATGSNVAQVSVPGSAGSGDIAVMFDWAVGGTIAGGTPSGWTVAQSVTGAGGEAGVYYKVLVGGDVGATITGLTTATIRRQIISVFRPDDDIDGVTTGSGGAFSGSTDPPNQSVAASGQATPVLVVAGQGASGTVDMSSSPGFDGVIDDPLDATPNSRFGYKIYNSSPANHTISSSLTGSNALLSCYIRVS